MTPDEPTVDLSRAQGTQVNLDGLNVQVNNYHVAPADRAARTVEPVAIIADVLTLLQNLERWARFDYLPAYLRHGSDVSQMARTVRVIGRIRLFADLVTRDEPSKEFGKERRSLAQPLPPPTPERDYALPSDQDERLDQPPQPWLDMVDDHERLMVLADPGMGKSWLIRTETQRRVRALISTLHQTPDRVEHLALPLPIRADVLALRPEAALPEAVAAALVEQGLLPSRSSPWIASQIRRGNVVLLIDALDEVPRDSPDRRISPRRHLDDLLRGWAQRCPNHPTCILTARLTGYLGAPLPGTHEVELLPFTPADVTVALSAWDLPEPALDRVQQILQQPGTSQMVRVPLLLALLCSLAVELPDRTPLPTTHTGLYHQVLWLFLSGTHRSSDIGSHTETTSNTERSSLIRVLSALALRFADGPRGWVDRMSQQALLDVIQETNADGDAAQIFASLTERAGVLVPTGDPHRREQQFMFLHRTFAEYLVARELALMSPEQRMDVVTAHLWFDPAWEEVLPMLGGVLGAISADPTQPTELAAIIEALLTRPDPMNRALHTALRMLGESDHPDSHLTAALRGNLQRRIHMLARHRRMHPGIHRALSRSTNWPAGMRETLLELLDSAYAPKRVLAITALATRRPDQELEKLFARHLYDLSVEVRSAAITALELYDSPGLRDALLRMTTSPYPAVRRVGWSLLAARDRELAGELLLADHTFPAENFAELRYERHFLKRTWTSFSDGPESYASQGILDDVLLDHRNELALSALRAYIGRNPTRVIPRVLEMLQHPSPDIRRGACEALRGVDDPRVHAAMFRLLNSETDRHVQSSCAATLVSLKDVRLAELVATAVMSLPSRGEIAELILTTLDCADLPNRLLLSLLDMIDDLCMLADQVGAHAELQGSDPEQIRILLYCFKHPPFWTGMVTQDRLTSVYSPSMNHTVKKVLSALRSVEPETWAETTIQLGWDDSEFVTHLLSLIQGPTRRTRLGLAIINFVSSDEDVDAELVFGRDSLGKVEDPRAIDFLLKEARSASPYVRGRAFRALRGRHDPRILLAATHPSRRARLTSPAEDQYAVIDSIVDRLYQALGPRDRSKTLRQLETITRKVLHGTLARLTL